MWAKITAVAGTVIGWGTAGALILLEQHPQYVLLQAFALSVGIVSVAWLMLACRNRPLGAAFELGYDQGRRDAMRDTNRAGRVVVQMPVRDERHAAHG